MSTVTKLDDTRVLVKLPDKPLRVIRRRVPRAIRLCALSTLLLGPAGMVMADTWLGFGMPLVAWFMWSCWRDGSYRP